MAKKKKPEKQLTFQVRNEVECVILDIIDNTNIPPGMVSKQYLNEAVTYLENKYGFIRALIKRRAVDDGVNYED